MLILSLALITACSGLPSEEKGLLSMGTESAQAAPETIQAGADSADRKAVTTAVKSSSHDESLQALSQAQIIYLGETHDSVADHQAQLEIIQALVGQGKTVAIAFEMFQRPFQPVLDRYSAGEIDAASLVKESEYNERWGFDWSLYEPIVSYGKAQNIPLLAANTPQEITRQVASQGLDSLDTQALAQIPPLDEIYRDNVDYRSFVAQAFVGFHGHGSPHGDPHGAGAMEPEAMKEAFERFFSAQVLWDETMAETVANYHRDHPETTIVVLAGQGHVIHGWGIPDRVARRISPDLKQATVLLNPSAEMARSGEGNIADYFWFSL
jgi:uncharacterized iron-regulated protein